MKSTKSKLKWTREITRDLSIHSGIDNYILEKALLIEIRKENRKKRLNNIFKK